MNVSALEPDAPAEPLPGARPMPGAFEAILDAAGSALDRAAHAERAFVERRGGLIEMVVERAGADVMLQIAATAAQRTTQAVSTLFGIAV